MVRNAIVNKMEQPSSNSNKQSKTIVDSHLDHVPWTLQINTQVTGSTLQASVTSTDTLTFYTSLRGQSANWAKLCPSSKTLIDAGENFPKIPNVQVEHWWLLWRRAGDSDWLFIILNWSIDIKSIFCSHIKAWGIKVRFAVGFFCLIVFFLINV